MGAAEGKNIPPIQRAGGLKGFGSRSKEKTVWFISSKKDCLINPLHQKAAPDASRDAKISLFNC